MKKLLPLLVLFFIAGCSKKDSISPNSGYVNEDITAGKKSGQSEYTNRYSGAYLRNYFTLICRISTTTQGFFPPQVARAYGYVGIANYEAVVNGIKGAKSLAGQIGGFDKNMLPLISNGETYNWAIASNAATAEMIRRMFETHISDAHTASVDSMEAANLAALLPATDRTVAERSVKYGKAVAAAVYEYSKTDGGHHSFVDPFQLPYSMPPEPFCWVPTGSVTTPVSPKWGSNRPYLQENADNALQFQPLPFSTEPSSAFYREALRVYRQVKRNTPEQVTIAKYWADDPFNTCTPAGHTFNIMTQLLEENNATLEKSSVAYAKLCLAENDAFISCWKGKYHYLLLRPVTYIQNHIDPKFNTVIGTPPFPAFTSGHSYEIGAGSRVFIDMFTNGNGKYKFTDYSQLQYGFAARTYTSFDAMAEECANSRFYGGIHYPMDNSYGLELGKAVGENIVKRIEWPKNTK